MKQRIVHASSIHLYKTLTKCAIQLLNQMPQLYSWHYEGDELCTPRNSTEEPPLQVGWVRWKF